MAQKDLTVGKPLRIIFLFALPLFFGNLVQQAYGLADAFIVGRTLGVNALASIGCTHGILFLLHGAVIGLTSGFAIVCARCVGAKDWVGLRRSFCTSLVITLIVSLLLFSVGQKLSLPLLLSLSTPAEILEEAHNYLSITLLGLGTAIFSHVLTSSVTALGDSRTSFYCLSAACLSNILLDIFFIYTLGMGVKGAAYATIISQCLAGILCLAFIYTKLPALKVHKEDWLGVSWLRIKNHLSMGAPIAVQTSVIALGAIAVQMALNSLGAESVAAFTAAFRIDSIGIMPLMSIGIAMTTFAGQNAGAQRTDRILLGVHDATLISFSWGACVALLALCFGKICVRAFIGEGQEHIVDLGYLFLVSQVIFYWILGRLFIVRGSLQGLGFKLVPTIAGISELAMRIIAAFVLVHYFGFLGICVASPLAWLGSLLPLSFAYSRWKKRAVENPPLCKKRLSSK